jgi:uncharacterized membrane protein YeaQ/YmgE (transglycosylase-associated protein family)
VGLITGWVSSLLVQGKGMGVARDMAVGIVGAVIGGFLANELDIRIAGTLGALAMSIVGSVLFLVVLRAFVFSGRRRA